MKIVDGRLTRFVVTLLMIPILSGGLLRAKPSASQGKAAQSSDSKKSPAAKRKPNNGELSEEQGGARGFNLPGAEPASKPADKASAKKTTTGNKAKQSAPPDHASKKQP